MILADRRASTTSHLRINAKFANLRGMRSITFLNQKGGVGKTTTAVNVAAGLVRLGQRVMLIDMDPQAHASLSLGVELGAGERSVYDVLIDAAPIAEVARYVDEKVTLVPASIDLVGLETELAGAAANERVRLLAKALEIHRDMNDWILIDCAPSLGVLSINALAATEEVIIPVQPHFFALQGLGKLLETVSLARDTVNPALRVSGVAMCMFEKGTKLAQEVRNDIQQFISSAAANDPWAGARLFETLIRRNIKLAEAPSFGQSIFAYAPGSHGAEDYLSLAREIIEQAPIAAASADIAVVEPTKSEPSAALEPLNTKN